ncbi:MAG: ThuA domain-containing protein [Spirochaetota bacterium]
MRITIWNEFRHEKEDEKVREVYPKGIHQALADHLSKVDGFDVGTATLDEPEQGLPQDVVDSTDVMLWWGHRAHNDVTDETAERVQTAVQRGMGLVVLHSGHFSKPFRRLMGTTCGLSWREDGAHERLWVTDPTHPIAAGIDRYFEVPETEMYGEFFDVPTPDELVFVSWFAGGEVFRSGMVWKRGRGRIFYFRPGHETFPIYYQPEVLKVIENACLYLAPRDTASVTGIGAAPQAKVSPEASRG